MLERRRTPARGRSCFVDSGGVRLHYLEYDGGEPPLLILPGLTVPAVTLEFFAERLAGGNRVLTLDLRGRGLSDKPTSGFSLPDYVEDVVALVEGAGLERPVVIGHALGARIAGALGALRPDLARAIVICDPPMTGPGGPPYATSAESFQMQLREAQEGTTVEVLRSRYPRWTDEQLRTRVEWLDTCDELAVLESHRNFQREDFIGYLCEVSAPAAFVYGDASYAVTELDLMRIERDAPNLQRIAIPDTGHMVPWESTEAFVAVVQMLLEQWAAGVSDAIR